jgi:hypothetical protein
VRTAVTKKGTYELKEFNRTRVPRTHPRNQLKKFVKREGYYELVEDKEDNEEEEDKVNKDEEIGEAEEVEAKEENNRGNKEARFEAKIESKDFEIRVPTLTAEQRS